jgi:type 1 glutamine amidotransferase
MLSLMGCVAVMMMNASCVTSRHPVPESDLWLTYHGGEGPGAGKHIMFISADQEYRSEQSMPMMAKILAKHHGFDCTVLYGVNEHGEVDPTLPVYPKKGDEASFKPHHVPGLEYLKSADLVVFFTRLLTLPDEQLDYIVQYLDSGKPFIALRTANHGFKGKLPYKIGDRDEVDFGEMVGGRFMKHHGNWHADSTRGSIDPAAKDHPIVRGVTDIWGPSDVYRTYPEGGSLPEDCTALIWGQPLTGRQPTDPPNKDKEPLPVAWVKEWTTSTGKHARVFHSTMGSGKDLQSAGLRRLIVNAVYWGLGMDEAISENTNVNYVDEYAPLVSGFNYTELGVKPQKPAAYR